MDLDGNSNSNSNCNPNAPVLPPQRKRRRPPLACERCRQQKIKCDRKVPCNQCVQAQKTPCTYTPDDRLLARRAGGGGQRTDASTPPPSSSTSTTGSVTSTSASASRNANPFDTWNHVPALSSSVHSGRSADSTTTTSSRRSVATTQEHDDDNLTTVSNLGAITGRLQMIEERLSTTRPQSTAAATESRLSDQEKLSMTGIFSKTRLFGQSNWRNSVDQFDEIIGIYHRSQSDKSSEIASLLDNCKALARSIKTAPQACLSTDPRSLVPAKHVADQLVYEYLRTFEYIYRVLHVPSFQEEYTRYWENPQSASTSFVMKLLLVMSIGSCFNQDATDSNFSRLSALQWINAAQSWLGAPSQKSRITLTGLQIHCLLLVSRQVNGVGADLVWISAGSLLCTAMHMGLHRDPSNFPKVSPFHAELRRRLWATVMEIVVQSSMDSGGIPTISASDFDCNLPSNLDDVSLNEAGTYPAGAPSANSMDTFTQSSLQIALARSLPIRLKIAKSTNGCGPGFSYEETIRIGSELSSICRANSLEFASFKSSQGKPLAFHVKVLDLLVYRFLISLHHAFAIRSYANLTYYFSRKISLDCSLELLSPLSSHSSHSQPQVADPDYIRLVTSASGLFRNVPLQAAINVASELIKQLKEDAASSFTPTSTLRSRRELQTTIEDYFELLGNRIRAGETNVKGFVMFSCVLAQIKAMQSGASVEEEILKASTDSLRGCGEILKLRKELQQSFVVQSEWVGNIMVDGKVYPNDGFEWQDLMQISDNNLWDPWLSSCSMQVENEFSQ